MKFTLEKIVKVMDKTIHDDTEELELKNNYDFFMKGVYSILISFKETELDIDADINTTDMLITIPEEWENYFKIIDPEYVEFITLEI